MSTWSGFAPPQRKTGNTVAAPPAKPPKPAAVTPPRVTVTLAHTDPDDKPPTQGDQGRTVQAVQTLLTRLGYADLTPDGDYGPITEAAVAAAREKHGITDEDGFGPKLRTALRDEFTPAEPPPAPKIRGRRSRVGAGRRGSGTRGVASATTPNHLDARTLAGESGTAHTKEQTMSIEVKRSGIVHGREHKGLPMVSGVKVLDEDEGIVEAIVSVTGVKDEVNDIIVPGAYRATLAKRIPKGVNAHDWEKPIARTLHIKELMPGDPGLPKTTARGEPWPAEAGALMVKTQFNLATSEGRDAYENVKFFAEEQEWSIGYNVPRGGARIDQRKGIRYINRLDLFEYSPVLFGAAPLAGTLAGVKSYGDTVSPDGKALRGSYEEISERVQEAIDAVVNGGTAATDDRQWVWVRATMPDHVIARVEGRGADRGETFLYPYTIAADGNIVIGQAVPVTVEEVVVPKTEESDDDVIAVTEIKGKRQPWMAEPFAKKKDDDEDDEEDPDDEDDEEKGFLSASEIAEMANLRVSAT